MKLIPSLVLNSCNNAINSFNKLKHQNTILITPAMKKITLFLLILSSSLAYAQLPVSQVAGKKKVLIEEFTGHQCQYCPDGHKRVDQLIAANPGKVYGVNIHTGGYAGVGGSYTKDFKTTDGDAIAAISGMSISGYPAGAVNRTACTVCNNGCNGTNPPSGLAMGRGCFTYATSPILTQNSYVNIAGQANLNTATRVLTINIEAYYTAAGPASNKLTVMLLQDKIMGPQSGGSQWYPAMMVGSNYTHNKALRDVLTAGATGETMTGGTAAGTLYTKTITYTVPTTIKNISVVLADLSIIAFVSETEKNIMTVTKVPISTGTTELQELNAMVSNLNVYPNPTTDQSNIDFSMSIEGNVSVVVSNIVGQAVLTDNIGNLNPGDHTYSLNTSNLQNGLYLVSLISGPHKLTTTVSVNR